MIKHRLFFLCFLLVAGLKPIIGQGKKSNEALAVMSLEIIRTTSSYDVALKNTRLLPGSKNILPFSKKWKANDFVCFMVNDEGAPIDTLVISSPMEVRYEYPMEEGKIGNTLIKKDKNEILLKWKFKPLTTHVQVAYADEKLQLILLKSLPLNF